MGRKSRTCGQFGFRQARSAANCPSVHLLSSQGPGSLHWSLVFSTTLSGSGPPLKRPGWAGGMAPWGQTLDKSLPTVLTDVYPVLFLRMPCLCREVSKRSSLPPQGIYCALPMMTFIMIHSFNARTRAISNPILHTGEPRHREAMP